MGEWGGGRGRTEDPLRMGRDGDKPGAPVCSGPKQEEGTDKGGGGALFWVGRGRREGCGTHRERERVRGGPSSVT